MIHVLRILLRVIALGWTGLALLTLYLLSLLP